MTRRGWLVAGGIVVAVVGLAVAYDVLVETDEERLEQIVTDATGRIDRARIDRGRARWIDLERQPFELSALGQTQLYRAGDDAALSERSTAAAREIGGATVRAVSSGVSVEGDRATVTIRTMSDRMGMMLVELELRKHGDDWLVSRLSVRR